MVGWESFIIRLDILSVTRVISTNRLRIFHYSPWYTYAVDWPVVAGVENLSLFALIYLIWGRNIQKHSWESFIIRLDILMSYLHPHHLPLRIFHYSPWYTYEPAVAAWVQVENLSLFALIYLVEEIFDVFNSWESFIIRLDILIISLLPVLIPLRIFHYSPWYTYQN